MRNDTDIGEVSIAGRLAQPLGNDPPRRRPRQAHNIVGPVACRAKGRRGTFSRSAGNVPYGSTITTPLSRGRRRCALSYCVSAETAPRQTENSHRGLTLAGCPNVLNRCRLGVGSLRTKPHAHTPTLSVKRNNPLLSMGCVNGGRTDSCVLSSGGVCNGLLGMCAARQGTAPPSRSAGRDAECNKIKTISVDGAAAL